MANKEWNKMTLDEQLDYTNRYLAKLVPLLQEYKELVSDLERLKAEWEWKQWPS